jgi:hypothetical protein
MTRRNLHLNSTSIAPQSKIIEVLAGYAGGMRAPLKGCTSIHPGGCGGIEVLGSSAPKVRGFLRLTLHLNSHLNCIREGAAGGTLGLIPARLGHCTSIALHRGGD